MKAMTMLLCLLLLNPAAWAQPRFQLAGLLSTLKKRYRTAQVTGRFNDWRSLSQYRRHAGLHYGYDIALPLGSDVPAAWPGRVVAVTPWHGPQYGITVEWGGVEVTYGHLIPFVNVGDTIVPDQIVGRTVIDHVDVKMRNAAGKYIDYGQGFTAEGGLSTEGYELALKQEQTALNEVDRLAQILHELEGQAATPAPVGNWQELYSEGAVSKCQFEEARQLQLAAQSLPRRLRQARQRLAEWQLTLQRATQLRKQLSTLVPETRRKIPAVVKVPVTTPDTTVSAEVIQWLEEGIITREEASRLRGVAK